MDAYKLICDKGIKIPLVIVGDGEEEDNLKEQSKNLGFKIKTKFDEFKKNESDIVYFLGYIYGKEKI